MFGYLTADRGHLTPEEDARYRAAYCGLCRSLRKRWGNLSGFTLNYDQCFLILLLQSLYEAEEKNGEERCLMHPVKPHTWWQSEYTDYAADMNIALSYFISNRYPRQCNAMKKSVLALRQIEKDGTEDPDGAAETFAGLMAEVFVYRDDHWSETLRRFGASLGRILYILDACMDLDQDTIRNRFNPFRRYYGLPDNGKRFSDILRMLLGECLLHFDRLPLVEDVGILKNILCFGLWTQFDKKFDINKDDEHGIGPV